MVERRRPSWTMTLRDGLRFHDGTPVLARDVVASLRRWAARDMFGESLSPPWTRSPRPTTGRSLRLKTPFPLLPDCLGKVGPRTPHHAGAPGQTDPFMPVSEMVGSGPFRFVPTSTCRAPASSMRGLTATAAPEPPSLLAGRKPAFRPCRVARHPRRLHRRGRPAARRGGLGEQPLLTCCRCCAPTRHRGGIDHGAVG